MKRSREPEEHLAYDARTDPSATAAAAVTAGDTDAESQHVAKFAGLDYSAVEDGDGNADDDYDEKSRDVEFAMRCSLPPHKEPLGFRHYSDYESHYQKFHTNRCLECRKNFPTDHLLGVHIEECHDPLAKVARERGEHTYSCFVEGCERKCMTPQKRRLHLIDKHFYPKNFFFAVTREGVDGRRSLLNESGHRRRSSSGAQPPKENRRRASTQGPEAPREQEQRPSKPRAAKPAAPASSVDMAEEQKPEPEKTQQDTDMAELTGAMSALQFVPPSIRFGRGRAGFSKR